MKKILIVEDSPYYYERAKQLANSLGLEVILAFNGKQGVEIYKKENPTYVLMDICMPIMDGLDATKEITSYDSSSKIIICSSVGHVPIYKKQAIKNGAKAFLPKEFSIEEMEEILQELDLYDKTN